MADEDEIRELLARMTAAQRHGYHVPPDRMRVVLAALRFVLTARPLQPRPNSDPHDDAPRRRTEPYSGPAATVGDLRRQGLDAVTVACEAAGCWNSASVPLDALRLPEATPVPDIARRRSFRCRRCGDRRVRVTPDWSGHRASGAGRVTPR